MAKNDIQLQMRVVRRWYATPLYYLMGAAVIFGFDPDKAAIIAAEHGYKIIVIKEST